MAKIEPKDGKYKLGDSKDTDLEGIDNKKYDVFTEEEKLRKAKNKFGQYNWFVSYTITDKAGKPVGDMPEYTIKLDKPDSDTFKLYYYLDADESLHELNYDIEDQGTKKKIKTTLTIGDPPLGSYP